MSYLQQTPDKRPPCCTYTGGVFLPNQANAAIIIPQFANVTMLSTPGGPIAPVSVPDCGSNPDLTPPACGSGPYPLVACGVGQINLDGNCYAPTGTTENDSVCQMRGFKGAQAWKSWHGRLAYTSHDQGDMPTELDSVVGEQTFEPIQPASDGVKYLTLSVSASYNFMYFGSNPPDTGSGSRVLSIDQHSGVTTASGSDSVTSGSSSLVIAGLASLYGIAISGESANDILIGRFFDIAIPDLGAGTLTSSNGGHHWVFEITDTFNGAAVPGIVVTLDVDAGTYVFQGYNELNGAWLIQETETLTYTATTISYSHTINPGWDGTNPRTLTMTGTLSNRYPYSALYADAVALLAQYNLLDHVTNPFRMDALTNSMPFFHYSEPNYPVGFSTAALVAGFIDPLATLYNGTMIGIPTPAGYAPYWQPNHTIYRFNGDGNDPLWTLSYGSFAPAWCKHCTEWLNEAQIENNYSGAFVRGDVTGVTVQKWAEGMLFSKESHDFARPCGAVDRAAIDQTTITCPGNPNGNPRWPSAPCYCDEPTKPCADPADPSVTNPWNDGTVKGDFISRSITFNSRDVGEANRINGAAAARVAYNLATPTDPNYPLPSIATVTVPRGGNILVNIGVTQQCACFKPCGPTVIVLTPNAEVGDVNIPFPAPASGDARYGVLQLADVRQWMTDPLWQAPVVPCALAATTVYIEDVTGACGHGLPSTDPTGEMAYVYYTRRYEEARASLPAIGSTTAPALPSSMLLGCMQSGNNWLGPQCDVPQLMVATINPPSTGGAVSFAPWAFLQNQLTYNCLDGTLSSDTFDDDDL